MDTNDHPANIPPPGTWTAVTVRNNETFTGRVKFASREMNKVRLAWGAGLWDIDLDDIVSVKVRRNTSTEAVAA